MNIAHAARRSVTALFGTVEPDVIGREISAPTKSYATKEWAVNQNKRMSATPSKGGKSEEASGAEMRHMHMQLLAERDRVKELEQELKSMMAKKYENESSIIQRLRTSQDKLREQLLFVVQSKMDLCESTALEIERLRLIIAELTNHLTKTKGNGSEIDIDSILSKYTQITASQRTEMPLAMKSSLLDADLYAMDHIGDRKEEEEPNGRRGGYNEAQQPSTQLPSGNLPYIDHREMSEVLNNPKQRDPSLPRHLQPFPHHDTSRIDIRTVEMGDGKTWPDPFAAVDLQYTGWKYDRNLEKWNKFTSTQISSTVFETRLGNHENIIGLEQAVLTMTLGETARVWVPSRLGYGIHGADPLIPPNTDLVFELKLVAVRNEFEVGANDDNEPLDPRQLDHINRDSDIEEDDGYHGGVGGSQLTSTNVRALDDMNNGYGGGDLDYNQYATEDVYDHDPHQQAMNTFQDL